MATVFSAIIAGQIPGRFIWQDEDVAAFLTIAPITPGHTLVVPRAEVDQWQDLPAETLNKVMAVAQAIGQGVCKGFDAPRAGLLIAGLEVPHLHVHVFPAWELGNFNVGNADPNATPESLDAAAATLRATLRELGFGEHVSD